MKPHIDATKFGSITVEGESSDHDIVIRPSGKVKKRKKKLSKQQYGTSHTMSLAEAEGFFKDHGCDVHAVPTPDAIKEWNEAKGKSVAMFHVTC